MLSLIAAALIAAPPVAPPTPGELKVFGDWIVGCDNGGACQAVALVPEPVDRETYAMLVLQRSARGAPMRVSVPLTEGEKTSTLDVDGRTVGRLRTAAAEDGAGELVLAPQALAALRNGARARLGRVGPSASLKGLAATLLYIDAQQARTPRALPVVERPRVPRAAARSFGAVRARQLIGRDASECEYALEGPQVTSARLDARTSLALVSHPCGNGAYNLFSTAFLVGEDGRVRRATFDSDPGMGEPGGAPTLVNADWDADKRIITTFAKGRGLGDCGSGSRFAWDGARFRLVHQEEMGECRGSTDYITTWRARVVDRR